MLIHLRLGLSLAQLGQLQLAALSFVISEIPLAQRTAIRTAIEKWMTATL